MKIDGEFLFIGGHAHGRTIRVNNTTIRVPFSVSDKTESEFYEMQEFNFQPECGPLSRTRVFTLVGLSHKEKYRLYAEATRE